MTTETNPKGTKIEPDPRGLIREAFRIDGITEPDCRSIFLDWALGHGGEADHAALLQALLERHADEPADHPMRHVLLEGLNQRQGMDASARGGRRTGRRRARPDF
ncbi:MAG: hypothetical protein AAF661_08140 [Pseudomonadota bacterium]